MFVVYWKFTQPDLDEILTTPMETDYSKVGGHEGLIKTKLIKTCFKNFTLQKKSSGIK